MECSPPAGTSPAPATSRRYSRSPHVHTAYQVWCAPGVWGGCAPGCASFCTPAAAFSSRRPSPPRFCFCLRVLVSPLFHLCRSQLGGGCCGLVQHPMGWRPPLLGWQFSSGSTAGAGGLHTHGAVMCPAGSDCRCLLAQAAGGGEAAPLVRRMALWWLARSRCPASLRSCAVASASLMLSCQQLASFV